MDMTVVVPHPTMEAYRLLHEGNRALSFVEASGFRVDVAYLQRATRAAEKRIDQLTRQLQSTDVWRAWIRRYGTRSRLGSTQQLGVILFDELGHACPKRTATGRPSVDESTLETIDDPFVNDYVRLKKTQKLHSTYLVGFQREIEGEYIHPSFSLTSVSTFRSSCSDPNIQNIPSRVGWISKTIRRAFIPRPGHVLMEVDYGAIEVRAAAWYHHDPTMLRYIRDNYDLHRDMAAECFRIEPERVSKPMRHLGKNGFVFPAFYGDYYGKIAPRMYEMVGRNNLQTTDGQRLIEHMRSVGIGSRGLCDPKQDPLPDTFEHHMREVERRFWDERFPVYNQWRRDWWGAYQRAGWCRTLTGHVFHGPARRNEIINYPVQGTAFHCLLWSLIQTVRWLHRSKMKTVVVGQIHDSMILDVHRDELELVIRTVREIMCDRLRANWSWINTPLEVEVEIGEENWYEKQPFTP